MTRSIASIILLAGLIGCKGTGQTGAVDPFFGRTRVEPPRTGSVSGQTTDPSYSPASLPNPLRAPTPTTAPVSTPSAATRSGLSSGWVPPTQPASIGTPTMVVSPSATVEAPRNAVPPGGTYSFPGAAPSVTGVATVAPGDQIAVPSAALTLTPLPSPAVAAPANTTSPVIAVSLPAAQQPPVSATPTLAGTSALPVQGASPTSLSAVPTMSRPTVNALAARERITRTLDPRPRSVYGTASGLPCPVDAVPAVSSAQSTTPTAALPGRVIDITELPLSGTAPSARGVN